MAVEYGPPQYFLTLTGERVPRQSVVDAFSPLG